MLPIILNTIKGVAINKVGKEVKDLINNKPDNDTKDNEKFNFFNKNKNKDNK